MRQLGTVGFLVTFCVVLGFAPAHAAAQRWTGSLAQASAACLHGDAAALSAIRQSAQGGSYDGIEAMAAYWVCKSDPAQAKPWLAKASGMGSGWASQILAQYLRTEKPSAANTQEQIKYLTRAALQGNAWAARELGVLYLNGSIGLAADPAKASYWARYAEDVKEIVPDVFYLAESYAKGWGVPKNQEKAKALYAETFTTLRQAVAQGDPYADMLFYLAYSKGYGVEKNPEKALHWLQQAAHKGYPEAVAALKSLASGGKSHDVQ
ncbi:tetratricopeptide repeat protein [Acidithiobacillus sp. M4-SHS-6]|uniref:tetratricopeptide repeat protein n=1 Tax=Acidithiobacillus sp. M4-SHS-6 TaxID=3383024 RepID=UPI0039BE9578